MIPECSEATRFNKQWVQRAALWGLFFLICMGLGYPILNRYEAGEVPGLYDAKAYYAMAMGQPLQQDQADLGHRVLVPHLAKPIYELVVEHHLGTWNAAGFSLLVVNSFFIATTALLLVLCGERITARTSTGLSAALLFLVNFAVANLNLAGYVDSAVDCILMAVVWSMMTKRWWMLLICGVVGGLAKETFVPLCAVMGFFWWLVNQRHGNKRERFGLLWVGGMAIVAWGALSAVMASVPPVESPLDFAVSRHAPSGSRFFYLAGLIRCITAREFLYTFGWLLPLSLWRLTRLPRAWVAGGMAAGMAALAMGAYDDALGNATRAVFSAVGPMLSLSAAMLFADFGSAD